MSSLRHLTPVHDLTMPPPRVIGRYLMFEEISSGGMAAVHFGRLSSDAGFSRTVAIKYLHPHHARDVQFISMFLDEARLVSRIRHPNVATPLDVVVVADTQEVFLVMEYIHGETLARLIRQAMTVPLALPPNIAASIVSGALHGLHAAHEAVDEMGDPLNIVHRDISPQNIMVGDDGVPRVLDFGIAKAVSRSQSTREGQVKGKVSYMSPEQLTDRAIDRRADIFAAGIVLWEALTMRRLFEADDLAGAIAKILHGTIPRPSSINGYVSQALDRVVLKALNRSPAGRFQTARDFATALEEDAFVANARKVSEWVSAAAATSLAQRAEQVARIESASVDVDGLEDTGQSAESLLTVSQTIKLLQEPELHDTQETPSKPDEDVGKADAADAKKRRWEASTTLLPGQTPEQAAGNGSQAGAAPAAPPKVLARLREVWTDTALVYIRGRKKGLVVGGGVVALLLILAVGLALRSGRQRAAEPPTAGQVALPPAQPLARPILEPISPPAPVPATSSPGVGAKLPAMATPPPSPTAKARRMKPAKASKLETDCDPPFFIDSNGIRRVKAQCL